MESGYCQYPYQLDSIPGMQFATVLCSNCHTVIMHGTNYCPACGIRLVSFRRMPQFVANVKLKLLQTLNIARIVENIRNTDMRV